MPTKKKPRLAVFDLDETLIHFIGTSPNDLKKSQVKIPMVLPSQKVIEIGINIRPHWEALKLIKEHYSTVIFTASHESYANAVLNYLSPDGEYFDYCLYRHHCDEYEIKGQKIYVKNLDIFEDYDINDIVIIDNSVLSFANHLTNGIPIIPYYDTNDDGELIILAYYLDELYHQNKNIREANENYIKLLNILNENEELQNTCSETSSEGKSNNNFKVLADSFEKDKPLREMTWKINCERNNELFKLYIDKYNCNCKGSNIENALDSIKNSKENMTFPNFL